VRTAFKAGGSTGAAAGPAETGKDKARWGRLPLWETRIYNAASL